MSRYGSTLAAPSAGPDPYPLQALPDNTEPTDSQTTLSHHSPDRDPPKEQEDPLHTHINAVPPPSVLPSLGGEGAHIHGIPLGKDNSELSLTSKSSNSSTSGPPLPPKETVNSEVTPSTVSSGDLGSKFQEGPLAAPPKFEHGHEKSLSSGSEHSVNSSSNEGVGSPGKTRSRLRDRIKAKLKGKGSEK